MIKKILTASMLFVTVGLAEEYTQANRVLDMQKMAQAMQDIQSGFFYNNIDIVKAGVSDLKSTIVKIRPTSSEMNTTDIYEKWMLNSSKMTNRTQKRIEKYTDEIIEHFQNGDAKFALNIYNRVSAECMKCHTSLRKW